MTDMEKRNTTFMAEKGAGHPAVSLPIKGSSVTATSACPLSGPECSPGLERSDGDMSSLCWFPWFPKDWLSSSSVMSMTDAQVRAYFFLLNWQWQNPGCLLPDDMILLSKYAGHDMITQEMKPVLDRFPIVPGGWRANKRLHSIYLEQREKHSNRVRAGKSRSNATSNATSNDPQNPESRIQSTEDQKKETWLTPYWNEWQRRFSGGKLPAKFFQTLKEYENLHGTEETIKAWSGYVRTLKDVSFSSPSVFAGAGPDYWINGGKPKIHVTL